MDKENQPNKKKDLSTYSLGALVVFGIFAIILLAIVLLALVLIVPFIALSAPFYFYFNWKKEKIKSHRILNLDKDYQEYLYQSEKLKKDVI